MERTGRSWCNCGMRRLPMLACGGILISAVVLSSATAREAKPPVTTRVLCSDAITNDAGPWAPRPILGRVVLPTNRTLQAVSVRHDAFRWWAKWGLEVKQGSAPVIISIPPAWRSRAAVGWNNRGGAEASIERVQACAGHQWLSYPGGYHATAKGCIPLDVAVGSRQQRVYVSVGNRTGCPRR
jgi:hypothetical protein